MKLCLITLGILISHSTAWATSSESILNTESSGSFMSQSSLSPQEKFARTQAVLDYFKVPPEQDPQEAMEYFHQILSPEDLTTRLPFLDSSKTFPRFSQTEPEAFQVFQDFDSKQIPDFHLRLATPHSPPIALGDYHARLLEASHNSPKQPLKGLRIALDPGHMGGDLWDKRTGKMVRDAQGRKLSEGLMALQISFLLKKALKHHGAEVRITRQELEPVSSISYDQFDLKPYALEELRRSSLQDWFQKLLPKAPAGPELFSTFSESSTLKRIFSEEMRSNYFILRADLKARVDTIEEFQPDLTLVIHLDVSIPPGGDPMGLNPKGYNGTKAYVSGGFLSTEFAGRGDRKYFVQRLLDATAWNGSLKLGRSVIGQIRDQMGVRFDPSNGGNSVQVEPGLYARNLFIPRRLSGIVTYLETLFYNDPTEFNALSQKDYFMEIGGVEYPYSDRLLQISRSIEHGVILFVQNYGT